MNINSLSIFFWAFRDLFSSKLFQQVSIYTFFRLLNRSLPVILLPFLTHYLTPKDYSIIDIFTNLVSVIIPIIGLNTVSSTSRFYFEKSFIYENFVATILIFNLITLLILIPFSILFNYELFNIINIEPINYFLLYIVLFAFLEQNSLVYLTNLRLESKTLEYGLMGIVRTVIELLGTVLLILFVTRGWSGRISGQFLGLIVISVISLYQLHKTHFLKYSFNIEYLKNALSYGMPLILHTIAGVLLGFTNRFFIIKYIGIHEAGIFASAYQLCFIVSLFHTSFNEAWVPYLFKEITLNNSLKLKIRLVKITYWYAGFLILITFVIAGSMPLIYKLIGKAFQINFKVLFWILLGFFFNGLYKMVVNYLFYYKKTKLIASGTIFILFLNLILNYYFIKAWELEGAAIALCVTFFVHFLIFFIISNKYYPLPWFSFINK